MFVIREGLYAHPVYFSSYLWLRTGIYTNQILRSIQIKFWDSLY